MKLVLSVFFFQLFCVLISSKYLRGISTTSLQLEKTLSKSDDSPDGDDGEEGEYDVLGSDASGDNDASLAEEAGDDIYYQGDPKDEAEDGDEAEDEGDEEIEDEDDGDNDEEEDSLESPEDERRRMQQKFSNFKSYANAAIKPPQYAKKSVRHAISEYITPNQVYMMQMRNSPVDPNHSFGPNWSGFSKSG